MQKMSVEEIRKQIKKELNKHRYRHTISMAYTAQCLAMRYGCDIKKAERAAMLHDCAKCLSDEEMLAYAREAGYEITPLELKNVTMLHAKVGAYLAKVKYGEDDEDILNAVLYHTTGRPNMSVLEKIICLADYIEPDRSDHKELLTTRRLAFVDLDIALEKSLREILQYLRECNYDIDPATEVAVQYYSNILYQNMLTEESEVINGGNHENS